MIQIVTLSGNEVRYHIEGMNQFSFHDIRSLDEYEINVIDLSNYMLWNNKGVERKSINVIEDFRSISDMICNSELSKTIILLPQNVVYNYHFIETKYLSKCELKNMLKELVDILSNIYPLFSKCMLSYENTKSEIDDKYFDAAFYFKSEPEFMLNTFEPIIKSKKSNKSTVVRLGKIIACTLKINNGYDLISLLNAIGLLHQKEECPSWLNEIKMFDDQEQKDNIIECKKAVEEFQQKIKYSEDKLSDNMRLKSVLYTNGDDLVNVVFEILEEMLGCDLSGFVDEKKEDFLFEVNGTIFIGEIKGVSHNVKNQNVSQLETHYQTYLDEHEEINGQNVKALLIINHQKCRPLNEREPVKDTQINLAKRNGSVIIDTYMLLKLLEKYRRGILTREQIFLTLRDSKGLLT